MGVSCDRLLRGWSTVSAPLVSEKNRFRDQLMCLKDAGLLSGKAKNSDSKTGDSKIWVFPLRLYTQHSLAKFPVVPPTCHQSQAWNLDQHVSWLRVTGHLPPPLVLFVKCGQCVPCWGHLGGDKCGSCPRSSLWGGGHGR